MTEQAGSVLLIDSDWKVYMQPSPAVSMCCVPYIHVPPVIVFASAPSTRVVFTKRGGALSHLGYLHNLSD